MASENEAPAATATATRQQESAAAPPIQAESPPPASDWLQNLAPAGSRDRATLVIGSLLVVLGAIFLVAQQVSLPADWSRYGWPAYVIVPGLALLAGAAVGGKPWSWLAVPGSIVTVTGVILLFQTVTDLWQTWAYAWALVVPTAVGLGLWLKGAVNGDAQLQQRGRGTAATGVVMFLAFAFFFEGMLDLSHLGATALVRVGFPVALIVAGGLVLIGGPLVRRPQA